MLLNQGFKINILNIDQVKVTENSVLADYLWPGEDKLTVIYLFNN